MFVGKALSGILAVSCLRHSFFLPSGVVDMRKGER
jgi:hypothetical protein